MRSGDDHHARWCFYLSSKRRFLDGLHAAGAVRRLGHGYERKPRGLGGSSLNPAAFRFGFDQQEGARRPQFKGRVARERPRRDSPAPLGSADRVWSPETRRDRKPASQDDQRDGAGGRPAGDPDDRRAGACRSLGRMVLAARARNFQHPCAHPGERLMFRLRSSGHP